MIFLTLQESCKNLSAHVTSRRNLCSNWEAIQGYLFTYKQISVRFLLDPMRISFADKEVSAFLTFLRKEICQVPSDKWRKTDDFPVCLLL